MQAREVRALLESGFAGFPSKEIIGERLQIRYGLYWGVRFDFERSSAIWQVGETGIAIVNDDGTILEKLLLEAAEVLPVQENQDRAA